MTILMPLEELARLIRLDERFVLECSSLGVLVMSLAVFRPKTVVIPDLILLVLSVTGRFSQFELGSGIFGISV